jgi:methylenetetrahydrofolate dehydrogenase (NADP+) / methenyltetrahydrofolate cyclohydrolase
MTQILDGKTHADRMLEEVRSTVAAMTASHQRPPCLAVLMVGEDPASQIYVRNKMAACARTGVTSVEHFLPETTTHEALVGKIAALNSDSGVDGILLQLPLPDHLDTKAILQTMAPEKDVDGFHPLNQGLLFQGRSGLRPCTPNAVMHMLGAYGVPMEGKRALVIGRSEIVGKPMAMMLLERHATVTLAHSRTTHLPELCREADILVVAVGRPGLVEGSWIKPGAVVVDVGINRIEDLALGERIFAQDPKKLETLRTKGSVLCGDVRYGEAMGVAGAITPVPGGVGPLTIAGLLLNTLQARQAGE